MGLNRTRLRATEQTLPTFPLLEETGYSVAPCRRPWPLPRSGFPSDVGFAALLLDPPWALHWTVSRGCLGYRWCPGRRGSWCRVWLRREYSDLSLRCSRTRAEDEQCG